MEDIEGRVIRVFRLLCGCQCVDLYYLKSFFRHLSCVPKKGDPKKGTRRKFFTPCSVVLSTFRKQPALAHGTRKRWPQARQPPGSDSPKCFTFGLGRLAKFSHGNQQVTSILIFTPNPARPRSGPTPRIRACALICAGRRQKAQR